jgi:hypothetical protein
MKWDDGLLLAWCPKNVVCVYARNKRKRERTKDLECMYYVYMHACMYVCMYVFMYVFMYAQEQAWTNWYVCIYGRISVCLYVSTRWASANELVGMYVCIMYVCMYLCCFVLTFQCRTDMDTPPFLVSSVWSLDRH